MTKLETRPGVWIRALCRVCYPSKIVRGFERIARANGNEAEKYREI